ncbi:hypothetical protein ACWD0Z_30050 [Streptomyces sp. NPDC003007]
MSPSEVWDELRPLLGRDSIALSLPGFGTPLPKGTTATRSSTSAG